MKAFAHMLYSSNSVPFWMDRRTVHCLYLVSKFDNYIGIYNQCFNSEMNEDLKDAITSVKTAPVRELPCHSEVYWIPAFCRLVAPIVRDCVDVMDEGPDAAWLPDGYLDHRNYPGEKRPLMEQYVARQISPGFLAFCKQCWHGPMERLSEEAGISETDLIDVSSLDNIDALATSLKGEDKVSTDKKIRVNFQRRKQRLALGTPISMWLLLYCIAHMRGEEYDVFMDYVCGGMPILTDDQVREMEAYRKENIKDPGLEGTLDARVLSFLMVFYKV